ncbi:hypothetical protein RF55_26335, partial [Lasius niger]
MSDVEVTPGKPLPWTDEAKLREDGRCINWSRVRMEGRTTKSLQNMWTKINKEISEIEAAENGENGVITPSKPRTATRKDSAAEVPASTADWRLARKSRAKKISKSEAAVAADGSGEDNEPDMKKTPKKRA